MSGVPPFEDPQTVLITDSGATQQLTEVCLADSVGALTRGLAEYLAKLETDAWGVWLRFGSVYDEHADADDEPVYPSAVVGVGGPATHDASGFTPHAVPVCRLADGRWVTKLSETTALLAVSIRARSASERTMLMRLVEDGLTPVTWMYGARLALGHYHGLHATYALEGSTFLQTDQSVQTGLWDVQMMVRAAVPRVALQTLPLARPQTRIVVNTADTAV